MHNESTQDEPGVIAEDLTLNANRTIEDKNLKEESESPNKEHQGLSNQSDIPPVEAQSLIGRTSSPKRQRTATQIIVYAAFLLVGIVLGAVGMLLFQLSIGGARAPIKNTLTPVASG